jgi:uncharacterized membrane protein YfcA
VELIHWLLLLSGGVVAGVVNTLAGGGSLLTVPLLMLVGLSPTSANATNRIAILAQSATATATFSRKGIPSVRLGMTLLPSGLLGAALGAYLATIVSDDAFRLAFGLLMVPMALVIVFKPKSSQSRVPGSKLEPGTRNLKPGTRLIVSYFFVGAYAGFIQAGVGIMALGCLTIFGGLDLRRANAVKVFTVAIFSIIALIIFASRIEMDIAVGLVLAAASALGGYLGTLAAVQKGDRWARAAILLGCVALSIHLIFG